MQQTGMNTLYTKVSSVREQLILFAGQMESLEQDYNTVVAELENSFVDSKAFWERTTTDKKATASQKAGIALERLDQMASGLNLLDVQLSQVDQSYAKGMMRYLWSLSRMLHIKPKKPFYLEWRK